MCQGVVYLSEYSALQASLESSVMILLLLLTGLAATSLAQEIENPTWLIPSQEKPRSQDDQSFCEGELAQTRDTDLYQTRTSEILLPQSLPPAVCIIFPFAPDVLRYGAGTRGECHNQCCFFRPPSKNIPDPPPRAAWYESSDDDECNQDSLAQTKPIILIGKVGLEESWPSFYSVILMFQNGEERTVCVKGEDGVFSPVSGATMACAKGCCLFFASEDN